ncbi:MAG: hypothetical protein LUH36_00935, partial [Oscillospiraceae bacterium]|nr:hypothetical protein [Oscillospiraceae bacterium]
MKKPTESIGQGGIQQAGLGVVEGTEVLALKLPGAVAQALADWPGDRIWARKWLVDSLFVY